MNDRELQRFSLLIDKKWITIIQDMVDNYEEASISSFIRKAIKEKLDKEKKRERIDI